MSTQENVVLLKKVICKFNDAKHREEYFELYNENCIFHGYPPELPPGLEGAKLFYHAIWNAFPDCFLQAEDILIDGDKMACRYNLKGTQTGQFLHIPPTNNKIDVNGITIFRFENGKCVERWQALDELNLMRQLGVTNP